MEVLLVDDHPLMLEILQAVLKKAVRRGAVVYTAQGLPEAFDCARNIKRLELVLLDLGLPGLTGIDALKQFREAYPSAKVVVVSVTDDRKSIQAAFKAGAVGYIPKTSTPQTFIAALKIVLEGGTYVPAEALEGEPPEPKLQQPVLSARERDCLTLAASGKTSSEIAAALHISKRTVSFHLTNVHRKLGVTNSRQAFHKAIGLGLVALNKNGSPK